jgi:hypothetical protein
VERLQEARASGLLQTTSFLLIISQSRRVFTFIVCEIQRAQVYPPPWHCDSERERSEETPPPISRIVLSPRVSARRRRGTAMTHFNASQTTFRPCPSVKDGR